MPPETSGYSQAHAKLELDEGATETEYKYALKIQEQERALYRASTALVAQSHAIDAKAEEVKLTKVKMAELENELELAKRALAEQHTHSAFNVHQPQYTNAEGVARIPTPYNATLHNTVDNSGPPRAVNAHPYTMPPLLATDPASTSAQTATPTMRLSEAPLEAQLSSSMPSLYFEIWF